MGDKNKGFALLDAAYRKKEGALMWLAVDPALDILRDDARYFALLDKMNHPLARKNESSF